MHVARHVARHVSAQPTKAKSAPYEVSSTLIAELQSRYNASQLNAIKAGLDSNAVVLIQGPPGTGKTRTILGLLSIVTHSAPKGMYSRPDTDTKAPSLQHDARRALVHAASPWLAGGCAPRDLPRRLDVLTLGQEEHICGLTPPPTVRVLAAGGSPRPRVLVCAPSNSALDELVMRLLQQGYALLAETSKVCA